MRQIDKTMRRVQLVCSLSIMSIVTFSAVPAWSAGKNPDLFAAIAYSPSTGKIGVSNRQNNRTFAEKEALKNCSAADALIVGWVRDGWVSLAVSKSAPKLYGCGIAPKQADSQRFALQFAKVNDAVIVASVFSEK